MPRIPVTIELWDKFVQELHEVHNERACSFNGFLDTLLHMGLRVMKDYIDVHLQGGGLNFSEAAYQMQDVHYVSDSREELEIDIERMQHLAELKRKWHAQQREQAEGTFYY